MYSRRSLVFAAVVATLIRPSLAQGQAINTSIATTANVTLKTFTPVDSLFPNPPATATSFDIALVNTISGSATEYRVSRFSDFRDATWRPYAARPNLTVPKSWFPPSTSGTYEITLYFQVRNKNPLAGRPISVVNGQMQTQPDFFFSSVLGRRIRLVYFG